MPSPACPSSPPGALLQAELAECQQALRVAKAESSRRLRELQALQKQVSAVEGSEGGKGVPEAALERERQAREAAEVQLKEAKQALARKTSLVKELRNKVSAGVRTGEALALQENRLSLHAPAVDCSQVVSMHLTKNPKSVQGIAEPICTWQRWSLNATLQVHAAPLHG